MKYYTIFLVLIMLASCKPEPKNVEEASDNNNEVPVTSFYVGTYTNKESKGIYSYSLTTEGKMNKIGLAAEATNPSYLALSPNKKYLLAVNEENQDNNGFVSAYEIKNDSLLFKNKVLSGGAHPCHISINKDNYLVVSNYTGGSVGLLQLNLEGYVSDVLDLQQHTGKGTTKRQEAPHAHSSWFDNDTIISADLGTNELWFSKIDTLNNKLEAIKPYKLAMEEGAGPRHLTVHPSKNYSYVFNELDNTITSLLKSGNGTYEKVQTISTIPEGFTGATKGADIHISDDGKFVYASNRGHDSIAIFSVNESDGRLNLVGYESCHGENPRNFSLSPDNNFLIVANQDTNNLVSFKRNSQTGLLTFVAEIEAPTPVCILFN
ncbi:lactonase family protein [Cellulophaga sp. E16_2]|uniref:lactonase family protein n=1 Tax=Cellulophaga sp. E16_2 TaxID=2789297 RepID=UPI001A92FE4A|nr:lactonase family protein [Cellulophaga sp. E16_2]MBO0590009.1 lactonase family protein [Cellulophaga sp. E16_2]